MSDIVSAVLKFTFGFLANKARSAVLQRLKDGDVTDEECRRLIVRELDDIKSKLDGLARKDLLSSLCFLQEGINRLYQSLLQLDSNENMAESTEQATLVEATSATDTGSDSVIDEAVALVNAMTSLKIRANDRLKSAIESFKLAREKATEAFCNEALSIEDRIQATQIRMMARILESLEDPDASVSDCLQYLKQLHDIKAIQKTFSVLIDGGIKSRFNRKKRLNNASSVQLVNQILFEFARKFTKLLKYLQSCPTILCGEIRYNPVLGDSFIVHKVREAGVQVTSPNLDFTFDDGIFPHNSVFNSKGEILALTQFGSRLTIFKRSGESREVLREENESNWKVTAMDIDAENNIHLITQLGTGTHQVVSFKLLVFDENGHRKLESPSPFHINVSVERQGMGLVYYLQRFLAFWSKEVRLAVNKDGKIAILNYEEKTLYIGKVCLEQKSFQVEKRLSLIDSEIKLSKAVNIKFADFNSTKIIVADGENLYICTDNGNLERKITLTRAIDSVAINHAMKRILVKVNKSPASPCSDLLSYSETGELLDSLNLGSSEWSENAKLICHPNGPAALVARTGAILLDL